MRTLFIAAVLSSICGCAAETLEAGEESVDTAESAMESSNALLPNGIIPNGIIPNGIIPNALQPDAIPDRAMDTLEDPGPNGVLARMFLKYIVGCAFDPSQSFEVSYRDASGTSRTSTYYGSAGLAPEWATGPLSLTKQRWVSACIGTRTNFFGIPVMLSMRGSRAELGADADERSTFSNMEGAFWGNIFASTPSLHACYHPPRREYAKTKYRVCAAGSTADGSTASCGVLRSEGDCATQCTPAADPQLGFSRCGTATEVITSFLN